MTIEPNDPPNSSQGYTVLIPAPSYDVGVEVSLVRHEYLAAKKIYLIGNNAGVVKDVELVAKITISSDVNPKAEGQWVYVVEFPSSNPSVETVVVRALAEHLFRIL